MNTSLSKTSKIDRSKLAFNNYFQTYIEEALRVGLISMAEVANIKVMLVKLLEVQIQRYTRFESSSVKVETAEGLMRAILYGLDFKFKSLKDEEGIRLLKQQSLETLFREGVELIKGQVEKSKVYFERLKVNRLKVDNFAYNDTIDKGFTDFYPYYDPEFSGHMSAADIDYPLCMDEMKEEGITYVYSYLKKLYYENAFCSYFKIEDINNLLESSDPNEKELLINIFEMVLVNAIGRVLVHKDLTGLGLSKADISILQSQFENEKFPLNLLQSAAMEIINTFKINGFLKQYILCACIPVGKRIEVAVVNQTLDKIFVPFKRARDIATIDFKDGESLADDVFKEVIEAVCSAGGVTDKLEIFKTHIHSLKDMVDFLESECLYGREYQALYRSLSELELALLLKILTVEDEMHFKVCLQEIKQKEVLMHIWESELICFLGDKEEEFRCRLWPVIQNIKIQK